VNSISGGNVGPLLRALLPYPSRPAGLPDDPKPQVFVDRSHEHRKLASLRTKARRARLAGRKTSRA
jgi:hypothetical protein